MSTRAKRAAVSLGILAVVYVVLQTAWTGWSIWRAQSLEPVALGERGLGSGSPFRMFVAGDSAAAGFGASRFESSFAGRIARRLAERHDVTYRNVSVSGARMADLLNQTLPEERQDLIILSAGSNDLLHFTGTDDLERSTRRVLGRYLPKTRRLVLVGPGMIHEAGADPLVLRPLHRLWRDDYVEALRRAAAAEGAEYVDPARGAGELSRSELEATVSEVDHFHLSDEGHRWWALEIAETLDRPSGSLS